MSESNNITWHDSEVTKEERQKRNGHKSAVIWFTGLSLIHISEPTRPY